MHGRVHIARVDHEDAYATALELRGEEARLRELFDELQQGTLLHAPPEAFGERTESVLIELATGSALRSRAPACPVVLCPNTNILMLKFMAMLHRGGSLFAGSRITVTESHQAGKTSAAGTAPNPSGTSRRMIADRTDPECSPMPPVKTMASRRDSVVAAAAMPAAARLTNMSMASRARWFPSPANFSSSRIPTARPNTPTRPDW